MKNTPFLYPDVIAFFERYIGVVNLRPLPDSEDFEKACGTDV